MKLKFRISSSLESHDLKLYYSFPKLAAHAAGAHKASPSIIDATLWKKPTNESDEPHTLPGPSTANIRIDSKCWKHWVAPFSLFRDLWTCAVLLTMAHE
jgi:hypothetical protein